MFKLVCSRLFSGGVRGIAIFPFIIMRNESLKEDKVFINHEKIHIHQQLELLVIPFFIFYLIEFVVRYVQFGDWETAYYNISFEKEAYDNQENMGYISHKSFWSFIDYV